MMRGGPDQKAPRQLAVQSVLEDLAGLESWDIGGGNSDCLACSGVAPGTRGTRFDLKGAKTGKLDLFSFAEYVDNDAVSVKQCLNGPGRIGFLQVGPICYCFDEFCLVHDSPGKWVSRLYRIRLRNSGQKRRGNARIGI